MERSILYVVLSLISLSAFSQNDIKLNGTYSGLSPFSDSGDTRSLFVRFWLLIQS